jgi:signal transduction histidine kinase
MSQPAAWWKRVSRSTGAPWPWLTQSRHERPRFLLQRSGILWATLSAMSTFMLLFAITTWMWRTATLQAYKVAHQSFEYQVDQVRTSIERRLVAYVQVLRGGVGLFAASDNVQRDGWHAYVNALDINAHYPGIRGIGFAQNIRPDQLASHIRAIRSQGFPNYDVRPPGERPAYTAIIYLEPFDWRNQRAFGYDMFSEPVRHEAMVRAANTGKAATSGKVTLVQETTKAVQSGFLMYLPVYRKGLPLETVVQRQAALLGYVYAPFRMNDLMQGVLGNRNISHLHLEIFDGTEAAQNQMYDSLATTATQTSTENGRASAFHHTETFTVGGRLWTLRFTSLPASDAAIDTQMPRLILGAGTLISLLVAAVVWSLLVSRRQARALAKANTHLREEIEERTKLEVQLEAAKNTAETASRAKSEFLANVSHELRTPLTLILAPLDELLAVAKPPTEWRVQLERVERNALLLLNRVNDLLDFSKVEAGKFVVCWEVIALSELISKLAEDAAEVARAKGCSLTWRVDRELDQVCLDRHHVETILLNLIGNALKFTPEGGWIGIEAAPIDETTFQLSVTDSGIGIAQEQLPLLFQRFQQVDASSTRRYGGTGIGLALVKEMAQLMGGEVDVASELGRGSSFMVRLPREGGHGATNIGPDSQPVPMLNAAKPDALRRTRLVEAIDSTQVHEAPPRAKEVSSMNTPRMCVLVVDDSADMRAYIANLLGAEWKVVCAADGAQAWDMLQERPVDIVVSDVMMPVLDGLELTKRIKASELLGHIPVILVTARGGSDASTSGLHTGADDYLAKPFSPDELRARVHAAARMIEIQRQLREQSREAGMAMLATSILHNLGNVLNGVTVGSALIQKRLLHLKKDKLHAIANLLQEHAGELPEFFARDRRAAAVPAFLSELARYMDAECVALAAEVKVLVESAEHASQVIASQQLFAKSQAYVRELIAVADAMESALTLGTAAFNVRDIVVERRFDYTGTVIADRHKLLQILINLISNAVQALQHKDVGDRCLRLSTAVNGERVHIEIADNGVGIDPEHLATIFNQGFTTKKNGHGYGLHSSANWAREMGGCLSCRSDGVSRGATFVLELPLAAASAAGAKDLAHCALREEEETATREQE